MTESSFFRLLLVSLFCFTLLGWGLVLSRASRQPQMASAAITTIAPPDHGSQGALK